VGITRDWEWERTWETGKRQVNGNKWESKAHFRRPQACAAVVWPTGKSRRLPDISYPGVSYPIGITNPDRNPDPNPNLTPDSNTNN